MSVVCCPVINSWSLYMGCTEVIWGVQRFAGWLSQICDENLRMRGIFSSKFPPKVCAHAAFRRKFVPTNLQTSVQFSSHSMLF